MEETQSFRVAGTADHVKKIAVDSVDGQNVIYWEDIDQVFPGVQYIQNGEIAIKLLRDSNRIRIVPHCIKHYPGVVLDIVLSNTAEHVRVDDSVKAKYPTLPGGQTDAPDDAPISGPAEDKVIKGLQVSLTLARTHISDIGVNMESDTPLHASSPPRVKVTSKASLPLRDIVKLASKKEQEYKIEQRLISSLSPEAQAQIQNSSNVYSSFFQAIKDGQVEQANRLSKEFSACFQRCEAEMAKNTELTVHVVELQEALHTKQDEMKQLQVQALGQLAVLQTRAQAILTQNYELHEYPIPRLFVVLPQDSSRWDILDPFKNKFRLYFLCECEHTEPTNSKVPHHIHLAKHEGYNIARPTEFFQQYGPYVLTILKMLKFGITVTGVAMPAMSHLLSTTALDQATAGLQKLQNIEQGVDQVIGYIESVSVDEGEVVAEFAEQMENKEALEGADLRKLDTFLKDKDGNKVLGNLYRTVTIEGHVKWVCIDHFRANYQEKATKMFRDMVESLDGFFDENTGEVDVVLHSKVLANQFYSALTQAKSIYELKVKLSWETSHGDLKSLRDTLHKTNVAILDLDCGDSIGPAGDILNRRRRSDSLWQMMANGRLQSVKLEHINGIFTNTGASLQSMAHLRTLHIHCTSFLLTTKTEISTATSLITNCPGLQDLTLECDRLADLLVPFKLFQGLVAKSSVKTLRVLHDEENQLYSVAPHDLESTTLYLDIGVTTYDFSMVEPLLVEYGSTLEKLIASGIAETATSTLQKSVGSRLQSIRLQNSKLYIGDIERLQLVVAQAPNLSSVLWETASEWQLAMIRSFAEHVGHRTFKIVIEELLGELSKKDSQDLKQLLTVHNVQLETLNLDKINIWLESLDELDALVEAVQTGRGIKELNCMRENLHLSDRSIEGLASIVSQPELHVLRIRLKEEYMSVSILESIQWKHIRELEVYAGLTNQRAAMKALLDSMEKMSETIELEWFHFDTSHNEPTEEWELLQRIVSLLSLESLDLWVRQTFEQALALIQSMDFSRMHSLYLRADKWDSKEVQIILDNLQRATQLESIRLYNAEITLEQREQMESKGIELSDMV